MSLDGTEKKIFISDQSIGSSFWQVPTFHPATRHWKRIRFTYQNQDQQAMTKTLYSKFFYKLLFIQVTVILIHRTRYRNPIPGPVIQHQHKSLIVLIPKQNYPSQGKLFCLTRQWNSGFDQVIHSKSLIVCLRNIK